MMCSTLVSSFLVASVPFTLTEYFPSPITSLRPLVSSRVVPRPPWGTRRSYKICPWNLVLGGLPSGWLGRFLRRCRKTPCCCLFGCRPVLQFFPPLVRTTLSTLTLWSMKVAAVLPGMSQSVSSTIAEDTQKVPTIFGHVLRTSWNTFINLRVKFWQTWVENLLKRVSKWISNEF